MTDKEFLYYVEEHWGFFPLIMYFDSVILQVYQGLICNPKQFVSISEDVAQHYIQKARGLRDKP